MSYKITTICIPIRDGRVLLGMKKRGFGEGKWNGFGGKIESGETIKEGAMREIREESGLEPIRIEEVGFIRFSFEDGSSGVESHIFIVDEFSGEPVETEEMRPEWFKKEDVPYEKMWLGDREWLPYVLKRIKFEGEIVYDRVPTREINSIIMRKSFKVINEFSEELRTR